MHDSLIFNENHQKPIIKPSTIFGIKLKPKLSFLFSLSILFTFAVYLKMLPTSFKTDIGEKNIISLPDGSKIHLNAVSTISYDNSFNLKDRNIKLNGEAYFEIVKGKTPFIIYTDYGTIKVLGTTFNIRNRPNGFELGVNEGNVNFTNKLESKDLTEGQILQIPLGKDNLISIKKTYSNYPSWKSDQLFCDKTPLTTILLEIERLFKISITFTDPQIKEHSITGIINTQDLEEALSTISLLSQREFKLDGDQCTII